MSSQIPTPVHANENPRLVAEDHTFNVGGRRNPYEMRFDLLHLAKDILETNAHMARDDKAQDRKTFYTTAEVISTAKELNEFVSNSR